MDGTMIVSSSAFSDVESYTKEVKAQVYSILKEDIKLFGITKEDLNDPLLQTKLGIHRDDEYKDQFLHQTYHLYNIPVVLLVWRNSDCLISTPRANPDYTKTKLLIQYIKQKPKNRE
jgi:hypothetical protein